MGWQQTKREAAQKGPDQDEQVIQTTDEEAPDWSISPKAAVAPIAPTLTLLVVQETATKAPAQTTRTRRTTTTIASTRPTTGGTARSEKMANGTAADRNEDMSELRETRHRSAGQGS